MSGDAAHGRPLDLSAYATIRRLADDPETRFILALGAGAGPALGANVALCAMIEELGLKPRVAEVWGVSAGAVVGGAWAAGSPSAEIQTGLQGLAKKGAVDVAWGEIFRGLARATRGGHLPAGLVGGKVFADALRTGLKQSTFEACPVPFRCIAATDDGAARKKIFRHGPLIPAILRSMSIPGVMMPQPPDEDGQRYVDGAVVESTPVLSPLLDHSRLFPGRRAVVLATRILRGRPGGAGDGTGSFIARMLRTMQALQAQLWERQVAEARERKDATVLLLEAKFAAPELFDFAEIGRHAAEARALYAAALEDGRIGALLGAD